jgi:hypothetical protein
MNSRNPQAAQANPQMQTIQKITPLIFAYIYFLIPAAVVIYMIVSTAIRIGTQDIMFRTGIVQPAGERAIPPRDKEKPARRSIIDAASSVLGRGGAVAAADAGDSRAGGNGANGAPKSKPAPSGNGSANGAKSTGQRQLGQGAKPSTNRPSGQNRPKSGGTGSNRRPPAKSANSGTNSGTTNSDTNGAASKAHPRSKDKRERKAR